ncbi:Uncharacterised protein [uncultured archaeon]|nr:Uncharacterised protein [uncultured archaeon]
MVPFPTGSRKLNFTDTEEVTSADLNSLAALLHQLAKDFNVNFFQGKQAGFGYPGCILNGCKVSITPGSPALVSISAGLILFSLDNDPNNYSGSLLPIQTTVLNATPPTSGNQEYFVDITYAEALDPDSFETRNVCSEVTRQAGALIIPTLTSNYPPTPVILLSNLPTPKDGYSRIGKFTLDSTGAIVSQFAYTLPYVWNLQNWPGDPHQANLTTTLTLADSLSAIRAAIADILGPTSKWYEAPAININDAVTEVNNIQAQINVLQTGVKSIVSYGPGSGNITVPAGVSRMWVRCWGPGGDGAPTVITNGVNVGFGGAGGGGGYVEGIVPVTPGNVFPYYVGNNGSGIGTAVDFTSIGYPKMDATCGGNGQNLTVTYTGSPPSVTITGGQGGAGGSASGGTLNVNGTKGGNGWEAGDPGYFGNVGARLCIGSPTGGFPFTGLGFYGRGGFAGPVNGGAGGPGVTGYLLIYYM